MTKHLVCVGACYLDTILTVPHYPAEDEKLRASQLTRRRGGNCPNTLEVLQQLIAQEGADSAQNAGTSLVLLAVLPSESSSATKLIRESLPGIDLSHCLFREECEEAASSYIIKSQEKDSRTIVNYNELPEMSEDEFVKVVEKIGESAGWWHFEGRIPSTTLACMQYLRRHLPLTKISVEVEKPGREGLQDVAAAADVVFYSKSWAQAEGYSEPKIFIQEQGRKLRPKFSLLCCTWGDQGGVAVDSQLNIAHCPARQVPDSRVIDAIGAGDTFIAGLIFAYALLSSPFDKALDFAVRLAGHKVAQEGFGGLVKAVNEDTQKLKTISR